MLKADSVQRMNQDSSERKRSSSLTEPNSRRRERTATIVGRVDIVQPGKPQQTKPSLDKNVLAFYEELTETCIDLMARYTFSPCSARPKR